MTDVIYLLFKQTTEVNTKNSLESGKRIKHYLLYTYYLTRLWNGGMASVCTFKFLIKMIHASFYHFNFLRGLPGFQKCYTKHAVYITTGHFNGMYTLYI